MFAWILVVTAQSQTDSNNFQEPGGSVIFLETLLFPLLCWFILHVDEYKFFPQVGTSLTFNIHFALFVCLHHVHCVY